MVTALFSGSVLRIIVLCCLVDLIALSTAATVILSKRKTNPRSIKKLICIIIFLVLSFIMFSRMSISASKFKIIDQTFEKDIHITGTVNNVLYNNESSAAIDVTISSLDKQECSIKSIIKFEEHIKINENDKFSLVGKISRPSGNDSYLISDGFYGKISCSSESELNYQSQEDKNTFLDLFSKANESTQEFINSKTDERTGALVGALLLGNRDGLYDETVRDFRRCGISHMLALSGLHMCIVMGFFDLILRILFIDKKIRCVILTLIAVAYLVLTGFSPSASRDCLTKAKRLTSQKFGTRTKRLSLRA